jgi:dipeptidyl aminopeptidase/acylaminoacyl peptidase
VACLALLLTSCHRQSEPGRSGSAAATTRSDSSREETDLASARKEFATKLRVRNAAPQKFEDETPPAGVRDVKYDSGNLSLRGWLSANPGDGKKHPAVVFLHGGFAFAEEDWRDAAPFVPAGYVLFMPMLRGENGNPGVFESFYGEVDDAIAAGEYVASLPYVDRDNVFLAGHSAGGMLAVLTAMMPSPYKAVVALSAYVDMKTWAAASPPEHVPYNRADSEEIHLRDPMAFVASLRRPLILYVEPDMRGVNEPLARKASALDKECDLVVVPGNHQSMVAPAVKQAIGWFKKRLNTAPR